MKLKRSMHAALVGSMVVLVAAMALVFQWRPPGASREAQSRTAGKELHPLNGEPGKTSHGALGQANPSRADEPGSNKAGPDTLASPDAAQSGSGMDNVVSQAMLKAGSSSVFIGELAKAVEKMDVGAISEALSRTPRTPECVEALVFLLKNSHSDQEMCRYTSEALLRAGTAESVGFVLGRVQTAYGGPEAPMIQAFLPAFDAPTTVEGARVLLDFLLGSGHFADSRSTPPEELRHAARKAVRNASDFEAVGELAKRLYMDSQTSGRQAALQELMFGISHPNMLSSLAVQAFQNGSPEDARKFMGRLGQGEDQNTVQAMVKLAEQEPALMDSAADILYSWSQKHPAQALPGLFIEYLSDSKCPPAQRIVAAFGLAGVQDKEVARRSLDKALAMEKDESVRANVANLQALLRDGQPGNSPKPVAHQ